MSEYRWRCSARFSQLTEILWILSPSVYFIHHYSRGNWKNVRRKWVRTGFKKKFQEKLWCLTEPIICWQLKEQIIYENKNSFTVTISIKEWRKFCGVKKNVFLMAFFTSFSSVIWLIGWHFLSFLSKSFLESFRSSQNHPIELLRIFIILLILM